MARLRGPADTLERRRLAAGVAGALGIGTFVLAAVADSAEPGATPETTLLDLAVGLAFVGGAAVASGPARPRWFHALVGIAWLVGSFVPAARLTFRSVFAVGLIVFPTGRPRGATAWALVCLAIPIASPLVPKPFVAALFAVIAVNAAIRARPDLVRAWYPIVSAGGLAVLLAGSWAVELAQSGRFDAGLGQLVNELALIAAGAAFPLAVGTAASSRAVLADRVLGDERFVGLDGLATVLGDVLGDPRLEVLRLDGPAGGLTERGAPATGDMADGRARLVVVDDGGDPLAAVAHRSTAMAEPSIAAAVGDSVRLAVLNIRWQEALTAQLADLEAARARLVAATDHQRTTTAAELREQVVEPIRRASRDLVATDPDRKDGEALAAVTVARTELDAAAAEILELVRGIPPARLGDGGLIDALRELAGRCPVPVTVTADPDVAGGSDVETALFYVCSEALTNAVKHANADWIRVDVRRVGAGLRVVISDNGRGGARLGGSGLQGLTDRLAARGGRLRVESPPGAGTTLTAEVPG